MSGTEFSSPSAVFGRHRVLCVQIEDWMPCGCSLDLAFDGLCLSSALKSEVAATPVRRPSTPYTCTYSREGEKKSASFKA